MDTNQKLSDGDDACVDFRSCYVAGDFDDTLSGCEQETFVLDDFCEPVMRSLDLPPQECCVTAPLECNGSTDSIDRTFGSRTQAQLVSKTCRRVRFTDDNRLPPPLPQLYMVERSHTYFRNATTAFEETCRAIRTTAKSDPDFYCDLEVHTDRHTIIGVVNRGFDQCNFVVNFFHRPITCDALVEFQRMDGDVVTWCRFYTACIKNLHDESRIHSLVETQSRMPVDAIPASTLKEALDTLPVQMQHIGEDLRDQTSPYVRIDAAGVASSLVCHLCSVNAAGVAEAVKHALRGNNIIPAMGSMLGSKNADEALAAAIALTKVHGCFVGGTGDIGWDAIVPQAMRFLSQTAPSVSQDHTRRLCVQILHALSQAHGVQMQHIGAEAVLAKVVPSFSNIEDDDTLMIAYQAMQNVSRARTSTQRHIYAQ